MSTEAPDEPLMWLRGERAALGPFTRDLVDEYWRWEQDPQVIIGYGRQTPESREARIAGYDSQARNTQHQARFTVYDVTAADSTRPVGTTALIIDHQVRTAEYVILLGPEGRGRGLARDATRLTLDYAFHVTNLRAVWLKVLEHNTAGIRAYEGAGFKQVGRLRRAGYWLGAECDEIIMDAVANEFRGPSLLTRATGHESRSIKT